MPDKWVENIFSNSTGYLLILFMLFNRMFLVWCSPGFSCLCCLCFWCLKNLCQYKCQRAFPICVSLAIPAFFWLLFARNIFFCLFMFNLFMSLTAKSIYFLYSFKFVQLFCVLNGYFNPFTFNAITEMPGFVSVMFLFSICFMLFLIYLFLLYYLLLCQIDIL